MYLTKILSGNDLECWVVPRRDVRLEKRGDRDPGQWKHLLGNKQKRLGGRGEEAVLKIKSQGPKGWRLGDRDHRGKT